MTLALIQPLHAVELTIVAVVIILTLSTLIVWLVQERVAYQPPRPPWPSDEEHVVRYRAADGQQLFGFLLGDRAAASTVIVFHGNADLAAWQIPWARELAQRSSARVLLAEYRGYGGVTGRATYAGVKLDARAALDYARAESGAQPESIVLFGHSLGTAVATELAGEMVTEGTPPRALVLQSPFTSARDMTHRFAPRPFLVAWPLVTRVHYDTAARVRTLPVRVWVSHGGEDLLVPARMGRAVFAAAKEKGELLEVPGAAHNDVMDVGGEAYWKWLVRAVAG